MKEYNINRIDNLSLSKEMINQIKLFNEIPNVKVEVFSPKENIINFNKDINKLYLLLDGKAKIYMVHEDGKRSLIQFLETGDLIGELTLIGIEKNPKDVVAINKCTCLAVSFIDGKEKLLLNNDFLLYLNRYLGTKLLKRTEFFAKNQNYELKNRLAAYILLSEHNNKYTEKHTETAEFLGTSYRHLLYTLKNFEDEGYLTKDKKGYIINSDKLKSLSKDIY